MKSDLATLHGRLAAIVFASFALSLAPLANASDGVIELNAARAAAGDITPGDAPGSPITISRPGSYRLTGNLGVLTKLNPSATLPNVIEVRANDVSIDLNGFRISCDRLIIQPPIFFPTRLSSFPRSIRWRSRPRPTAR